MLRQKEVLDRDETGIIFNVKKTTTTSSAPHDDSAGDGSSRAKTAHDQSMYGITIVSYFHGVPPLMWRERLYV